MDINVIDIIGERVDGGIDLYIVISDAIEESEELQTQLLDKIENYLAYINSSELKKDFPCVAAENVYIKLKFLQKPSEALLEWLHEIKTWVNSNGTNLLIVSSTTVFN